MNARAREGWEVRAVTPWNPWEGTFGLITIYFDLTV